MTDTKSEECHYCITTTRAGLPQYSDWAAGWTTVVGFPARQNICVHHNVQTYSASYSVGTGVHSSG
jgi:hypothetical protein